LGCDYYDNCDGTTEICSWWNGVSGNCYSSELMYDDPPLYTERNKLLAICEDATQSCNDLVTCDA